MKKLIGLMIFAFALQINAQDNNALLKHYEAYFSDHTFEKTVHTQYYKRLVSTNQALFFSDRNSTVKTENRGSGIWNYIMLPLLFKVAA